MNDITHPPATPHRVRPAPKARLAAVVIVALTTCISGCAKVGIPRVSMPTLGGEDKSDSTATPRDLIGAKLANPRANPDTPNMTVGKMIEFADRYLACDCAKTRFVRSWEKTDEGYRLYTNSGTVKPIDFVCADVDDGRQCYLLEIDRGPDSETIAGRFVPGSEFIQFLYDNGVQCEREAPCP